MRVKRVPLGIVAASAAISLAACSSGGGQSTDAESSSNGVVIKYISSTILESPEAEFEQALVDEFNAQDNGITVEVEGVAANDLMEKYTALATANQMPDFFMADMKNTTQIVDMGLAAEATEVFPADFLDQFTQTARDGYSVDGVEYGIPFFTTAQGIIYRTDLFEEAGVEPPKTWEELVKVAKALTKEGKYGITLVGTKDGSGAGRFQYVIRNFGVDEFIKDDSGQWTTDIGSEDYTEALRQFTALDTEHKVVPPGVIETDYSTAVKLLASGDAAMLITGSNAVGALTSMMPELEGKLGSFPIPPIKRAVSSQNGFGFFVSPTSEKQEAVAEFLEFFMTPEHSIEYSRLTGRLPTIDVALADPTIGEDPALGGFLDSLNNSDLVYLLPTMVGFGEVNDVHGEAYQSVLTGTATPEEASQRAGERAQAIADEANSQ